MAMNNVKFWIWVAGILATVVIALSSALWGQSRSITIETLASVQQEVDAHDLWIVNHDDWSMDRLSDIRVEFQTVLDSIRTVGELGERGRIESWRRFAVIFATQQLIMDELGIPKFRRPQMPDAPDTTERSL